MLSPVKNKTLNTNNESGVFLIELAILMIVIAVMIGVSIPLYKNYEQRNGLIDTKKRMDIVSKAFSNFTQTRFRLPCPADAGAASGEYGVEATTCTVTAAQAHGIIPYRTLGIPEQYAKDAYGNFFTYVVSPDFTADNRLGVQANTVNRRLGNLVAGSDTAGNYALLPRAQFCAPLDVSGTDITVNQNGNAVLGSKPRDSAVTHPGTTININRPPNAIDPNLWDGTLAGREVQVTAVAMALISHGPNGAGAYQNNGAQSAAGGAAEAATSNSDRIVNIESSWSNDYDDIIKFYTQDQIYAAAGGASCENL